MPPHPAATSYDEIAYPGLAFPQTHPALAESIGTLRGLSPAPATASQVMSIVSVRKAPSSCSSAERIRTRSRLVRIGWMTSSRLWAPAWRPMR